MPRALVLPGHKALSPFTNQTIPIADDLGVNRRQRVLFEVESTELNIVCPFAPASTWVLCRIRFQTECTTTGDQRTR